MLPPAKGSLPHPRQLQVFFQHAIKYGGGVVAGNDQAGIDQFRFEADSDNIVKWHVDALEAELARAGRLLQMLARWVMVGRSMPRL